jgi:protein-S-isoprenylcysteine O-methyltransferase Ste14
MSEKNNLQDDPRYQNHESRPDLAGEHIWGDTLQLLAFLMFIGVSILDYLFFGSYQIFRNILPLWVRLAISAGIFALAGYLSLYGIRIIFGEYREEPVMITNGMFSFVRHPIYLGVLLVYPAIFLLTTSLYSLLVWVVAMLLYNWLAKDEEERMQKIFGNEYQGYIDRVPKWIPRLRSFFPFKKGE